MEEQMGKFSTLVSEIIEQYRPSKQKITAEYKRQLEKLGEELTEYNDNIAWVMANLPPIPQEILDQYAHVDAWVRYFSIRLPFRFELEKIVMEWQKNNFDAEVIATSETTGMDKYGKWVSATEDTPAHWAEVAYAQRTYKVFRDDFEFKIVFDSRVDGSTCYINVLDAGAPRKDPVMEIICSQAVEAGELLIEK